jgi:DNA-binding NarL/FixJ family response regulator
MFTPRELELYKYLLTDLSTKDIAFKMKIIYQTAKLYQIKLYHKLKVNNRIALMAQEIDFLRVQDKDVIRYAKVS